MDITDTSDDDELVSGLSRDSDVSFIEDICLASFALSFRENKLSVGQMNWHHHVQLLLHENLFHVKHRMSLEAFNKLLDLLSLKPEWLDPNPFPPKLYSIVLFNS